jgi:hypothetical protein
MGDITNPKLLWLKAILFLVIGVLCAGLLWLDLPRWRDAAFFLLAIWAFCRAYYFAFYVIQHYADPAFKFSGLISFARYMLSGRAGVNLKGNSPRDDRK